MGDSCVTEQHHELTCPKLQIDAAQGMHLDLTHAVDLGEAFDGKDLFRVPGRASESVGMFRDGRHELLTILLAPEPM